MYAVEIYAAVRRFVFVDGNSRREAARVFGLNRETVAKMCGLVTVLCRSPISLRHLGLECERANAA
jgi:hypothetical protein